MPVMSRSARVLVLLLSISVVLTMVLWGLQRRLLYYPGPPPPPVQEVLPGAEEVGLETADGLELDAWWLPGGPTAVVVLPGNAGNRAGRAPTARALGGLGLSVLLVDYRGYGGNPGSPTEEGLLADARAAVAWADARDGVGDLVLFGESLGAGVAIGVAAERPPDALVLRSPFTSVGDMARVHFGPVPAGLVRDRFPSVERVTGIDVPMLVLATETDEVVPFDQSRRVAAAAGDNAQLVRIRAAGHNAPAMFHGEELLAAVEAFLSDLGLLPAA